MLLANPWGEKEKGHCYSILYRMTAKVTINKLYSYMDTHTWAVPDWSKTMLLCVLCVSVCLILVSNTFTLDITLLCSNSRILLLRDTGVKT